MSKDAQTKDSTDERPYTHLVLSGGGPSGFCLLGALQHCVATHRLRVSGLAAIHGTSAGAALSAMLLLCDADVLAEYLVGRPWEQALGITPRMWLDCFARKGLFGAQAVELVFAPLLAARGLDPGLTLAQLHDLHPVDLTMYTFDLNRFCTVALSRRTHPDLRLTDAVAMSAALPGVLEPVFREDGCFIDGGVLCNFPLDECLATVPDSAELEPRVLGITCAEPDWRRVLPDSTLLDLVAALAANTMRHLRQQRAARPTNSAVRVLTVASCEEPWLDVLSQRDARRRLLDRGRAEARSQLDGL